MCVWTWGRVPVHLRPLAPPRLSCSPDCPAEGTCRVPVTGTETWHGLSSQACDVISAARWASVMGSGCRGLGGTWAQPPGGLSGTWGVAEEGQGRAQGELRRSGRSRLTPGRAAGHLDAQGQVQGGGEAPGKSSGCRGDGCGGRQGEGAGGLLL